MVSATVPSLLSELSAESKSDLIAQLTGILWHRSNVELARMILDQLTPEEINSLANSYGIERNEK